MSMIRVENLTFSYPSSSDNIFENVNFQICLAEIENYMRSVLY